MFYLAYWFILAKITTNPKITHAFTQSQNNKMVSDFRPDQYQYLSAAGLLSYLWISQCSFVVVFMNISVQLVCCRIYQYLSTAGLLSYLSISQYSWFVVVFINISVQLVCCRIYQYLSTAGLLSYLSISQYSWFVVVFINISVQLVCCRIYEYPQSHKSIHFWHL